MSVCRECDIYISWNCMCNIKERRRIYDVHDDGDYDDDR